MKILLVDHKEDKDKVNLILKMGGFEGLKMKIIGFELKAPVAILIV